MQGIHNTPPPPNAMNNPRFRVWMRLWWNGAAMKTKTIAKDCRYDMAQTVALLNELGLAGRVAHSEGEWWVVNPLLEPIIE
jgi:predicted Rossmann fold nucleotide-binding protein DprA/Smf involved in DNA uptake